MTSWRHLDPSMDLSKHCSKLHRNEFIVTHLAFRHLLEIPNVSAKKIERAKKNEGRVMPALKEPNRQTENVETMEQSCGRYNRQGRREAVWRRASPISL